MTLTAIDIIVLLAVGAAGVLGFMRGFVTEVLALLAWVLVVLAIKFLHAPLTEALAGPVGTVQGAAVLSFAIIAGVVYFGGRLFANVVGARTRDSFLGPVDRVMYRWMHSPQLVIGFFPDWFAAPQPDWPSHTHLVGFPLWDAAKFGFRFTTSINQALWRTAVLAGCVRTGLNKGFASLEIFDLRLNGSQLGK